MPNVLAGVLAGVATDVGASAAIAALALWAFIPALIGLVAVERRDAV